MLNNINFSNINKLFSLENKEREKPEDENYYYYSEFRDDVNTIYDIKSRFLRKGNVNMKHLYELAHYFHHHMKTDDGKYVALGIPSTSESLREKLKIGCQQNLSKLLNKAQEIDLLCCVDDTFQFNAAYPEDNHAKKYIINDKVYGLLKDWYDEQVKQGRFIDKCEETVEEVMNISSPFTEKEIRMFKFSSFLYTEETERNDDEIKQILRIHYPELVELQNIINIENTNPFIQSDFQNLERRAVPNITREPQNFKRIEGIGIRDTSSLSSVKKNMRKYYLSSILGSDYLEFDVCSSVYRVTYLLNTGVWLPNSIDLYEKIWEGPFDMIPRDDFKKLCNRVYFSQSVGKASVFYTSKGLDKEETKKTLQIIKDSMEKNCGHLYGSEIFLYESRLYAEFALYLMNEGFNVVQVYDCMYVNNLSGVGQEWFNQHCEEVIKDIAERFYTTHKS